MMAKYVAFLRGINVGGNKMVKMEDLRKTLQSLKFKNVATLLASGNAIFETQETDPIELTGIIEKKLEKTFGHEIEVILRSMDQIDSLIASAPFKNIPITKDTRLYITFLKSKPEQSMKLPYVSPQKNFTILAIKDNALISVLTIIPGNRTVDAMEIIGKTFGKHVTTRNWNTVLKIAAKK